jgi:electron transfer flavoprotein alpha subunit
VVAVGRGFAKAEDLEIVTPLLRRLDAELGCSRPIAEDFKWLPQERQVGLTGVSVAPGLYLALGISGQVQHLAGIKGAKVVVSVNNDARAPMARNADYAVVADLYAFVPELLNALGEG